MTEEQQVAPETEATEETVKQSEATENTEGQDQSQPAEDDADGDPEAKAEDKSEAQKRRERRKAQMQRLQEEAQEAERKYSEQQERLRKAKEKAEQSNIRPKEADFQDYNEYLIAVGAYQSRRGIAAERVSEVEEATQAEEARVKALKEQQKSQLAQSWAEQATEAKARYADFEQVVYSAPISDTVAEMVAGSEVGADLAYYLGTHRELAAALSRATPIEAARELGRLEARLSLPKPNFQSNAPDPVNPVRPKPTGQKPPSKMSFEEYKAARMAGKL